MRKGRATGGLASRCLTPGLGLWLGLGLGLGSGAHKAAGAGGAPPRDQQGNEALHFLGHANATSMLEPAGSHGSIGADVGAGLVTLPPPPDNSILTTQLGGDRGTKDLNMPRVWLVKGLPLPLDFGLTAGAQAGGGGFSQISASLQWTVFEAFARPAVALRASYGKLYGLSGTSLNGTGGEAVASYGLFSYVTLFGRLGVVRHQGSLAVDQTSQLGFLLSSSEPTWRLNASWTEPVRAVGLRLKFGLTRLAATAEADLSSGLSQPAYSAKLSFAL